MNETKKSTKSKRLNIQILWIPIKESKKFEAQGWIKEIIQQLCKSEAHEFLFKGFSVVYENKPTPRHTTEKFQNIRGKEQNSQAARQGTRYYRSGDIL